RPVGLLVEVGLPAVAGGLVEPGGNRMPVLVRLRDDHRPAGADSDRAPVSAVGVPLTGQISGAARNRASSAHAGHLLRWGQGGRNGPVTQLGSGCYGLSTLQPGKWRASSGAGEAERSAPRPCNQTMSPGCGSSRLNFLECFLRRAARAAPPSLLDLRR